MIATLQQDFILLAKAKGMSSRRILFRHALRPSSLTLLTVAGLNVGTLIGGALIVEVLFNIPGMGFMLFEAIASVRSWRSSPSWRSSRSSTSWSTSVSTSSTPRSTHGSAARGPGRERTPAPRRARRGRDPRHRARALDDRGRRGRRDRRSAAPRPRPRPGRRPHGELGIGAWLAIIWLVGMLSLAILAPVLPIPDPTELFPEIARQGPSSGHLLGGDTLGRDLLSRIIWGGRASFAVGFGAVARRPRHRRSARPHHRILPRASRHHRHARDEPAARHPPVRAGAVAGDGARIGGRRELHTPHRRGHRRAGHRVDPDPRAHHPGQHPDLVRAGVRDRCQGHGRQELADHAARRPAQRGAGDVVDRAAGCRRGDRSPRVGSASSASACSCPRRRGATSSPRPQASSARLHTSCCSPPSCCSSPCCRSTILGDVISQRFEVREGQL